MSVGSLSRLSAFTTDAQGGNPAGVWIGDALPSDEYMQEAAAEVGYSETAFIAPRTGFDRIIRYFSPEAEVPFCGHATIASGVALGQANGEGTYRLATSIGEVPVEVNRRGEFWEAALTSVPPKQQAAADALVESVLAALRWQKNELDPSIPPMKAFAGAWHLVLSASSAERLAELNYDFERLKALMLEEELTTIQLIWRESELVFHSRNPFPVGGVVEDPATGAAAAAFCGYLRDASLLDSPCSVTVYQGMHMGRPSVISVDVPDEGGMLVRGKAVFL